MILVSSCLMGEKCRYDGNDNKDVFLDSIPADRVFSFCAETAGGLSTPRVPAEIKGGGGADVLNGTARVVNKEGEDVTEQFVRGAKMLLDEALEKNVTAAILKERSPSCGSGKIYDGSFSGRVIQGEGVVAALLRSRGIPVYSEEQMDEKILKMLLERDMEAHG